MERLVLNRIINTLGVRVPKEECNSVHTVLTDIGEGSIGKITTAEAIRRINKTRDWVEKLLSAAQNLEDLVYAKEEEEV